MLEYIRIELNKNRIDYKKHSIQAGTRKWRSILFWFHFLKLYLSKNETKYDERLEDFKKFWKSASKAVNIKECSCSCRGFLKNAICLHSLGYSHLKDLNWFGPKFTTRSCEFAYNNKRGAKKGSKYKKATSALMMDADWTLFIPLPSVPFFNVI